MKQPQASLAFASSDLSVVGCHHNPRYFCVCVHACVRLTNSVQKTKTAIIYAFHFRDVYHDIFLAVTWSNSIILSVVFAVSVLHVYEKLPPITIQEQSNINNRMTVVKTIRNGSIEPEIMLVPLCKKNTISSSESSHKSFEKLAIKIDFSLVVNVIQWGKKFCFWK